MPKVAVFTGAGASAGLGLPTMRELFELFVQNCTSEVDRSLANSVNGDLELLFELMELLQERGGPLDSYNEFLSHMAMEDHTFPFEIRNPHAFDDDIPFTYSQWDKVRSDASDSQNKLIELISNHLSHYRTHSSTYITELITKWTSRQSVLPWFTTNYDMTVEEAAVASDTAFSTGFSNGAWRGKFTGVLHLYKLHGSLAWYTDGTTVSQLDTYGPHMIQRVGRAPLTHMLMYPRRTKTYVEPYLTLIDKFKDALAEVEVLVSIGYGWRDVELLQVLNRAARLNKNLRILLLDPNCAEVAQNLDVDATRVLQCSLPIQEAYASDLIDYLVFDDVKCIQDLYEQSSASLGRGHAPRAARALSSLPRPLRHLEMALDVAKNKDQRWVTYKWILLEWWRVSQTLVESVHEFAVRELGLESWILQLKMADGPGKIVCCNNTNYFARYHWTEPVGTFVSGTVLQQLGPIYWGGPGHPTGSYIQLVRAADGEEVYIERPVESNVLGDPPFLQLDRPPYKAGLL